MNIISIILSANTLTVKAQSAFLRVITEDTPFYSNETDEKPLFYLPYTYYVRVLNEGINFYHVEYGAENGGLHIDGYVPKNLLFDDSLSAEKRYPSVSITTSCATLLYSDSETLVSTQYIFPNRILFYYGKTLSSSGETLYFVSYNNRLGYVKEEDVIPFAVPQHPNPLTFIPDEPEPPKQEDPDQPIETPNETLRYAIIGALVFAGVLTLFITLKNKPKGNANGYYEECDYE